MVGMSFGGFLVLLIISIVVSAILHYVMKYYIIPGFYSFLSKVIFGWIGACLGPAIFGKWFEGFEVEGVFIIPAILGCFALLFILVDLAKSLKGK